MSEKLTLPDFSDKVGAMFDSAGASAPETTPTPAPAAPALAPAAAAPKPESTPAAPPAATATPATAPAAPQTPADSGPSAAGSDDELPQSIKDYLAAHPEAKDAAKLVNDELMRSFSPRLQEAKKLREEMEALPQDVKALNQHLVEAYRRDPSGQQAFHLLARIVQSVQPQGAPNSQPGPAQNPYGQAPQDPNAFYQDPGAAADPNEARFRALEAHIQRQNQAHVDSEIQNEFREIERDYGKQLSTMEQHALIAWGIQNRFPTIRSAYEAFHRNELFVPKAEHERRIQEVATIQQTKTELTPPPSQITPRTSDHSSEIAPAGKNLKGIGTGIGQIIDRLR